MTLLGDILGYDSSGRDLMGVNRESEANCVACGRDIFTHTPEQSVQCLGACFGRPHINPDFTIGAKKGIFK